MALQVLNLYDVFVNFLFGSQLWAVFGVAGILGMIMLLTRMSPNSMFSVGMLYAAAVGMFIYGGIPTMMIGGIVFISYIMALARFMNWIS